MNSEKNQTKKIGFLSWMIMFLLSWWLIDLFFPNNKKVDAGTTQNVVIEKSNEMLKMNSLYNEKNSYVFKFLKFAKNVLLSSIFLIIVLCVLAKEE